MHEQGHGHHRSLQVRFLRTRCDVCPSTQGRHGGTYTCGSFQQADVRFPRRDFARQLAPIKTFSSTPWFCFFYWVVKTLCVCLHTISASVHECQRHQLPARSAQLMRLQMQVALCGANVAQLHLLRACELAAQCAAASQAGLLADVHASRQQGVPAYGRLSRRSHCKARSGRCNSSRSCAPHVSL